MGLFRDDVGPVLAKGIIYTSAQNPGFSPDYLNRYGGNEERTRQGAPQGHQPEGNYESVSDRRECQGMVHQAALAERRLLPVLRFPERADRLQAQDDAFPLPGEGLRTEAVSVKTSTLMECSMVGYQDWIIAMFLTMTSLRGVSSVKLHRDLEVTGIACPSESVGRTSEGRI